MSILIYYAVTLDFGGPEDVDDILINDLLNIVREHLSDMMPESVSDEIFPYDDASRELWNSNNPTGAVMIFNTPMDDAGVLTTQSSSSHWVFTPVRTNWDLNHPLAGHREFGVTKHGRWNSCFLYQRY